MAQKKLPEIYAYILRNIVSSSNGTNGTNVTNVTTEHQVFISINRTIYRAPKYLLRQILCEFVYEYKVLRKLEEGRLLIIINKDTEKQLERLKEYIFPMKFCFI